MNQAVIGKGYSDRYLDENDVREIVAQTFSANPVDGQRLLLIVPDSTRTSPVDLLFRVMFEEIGQRVKGLDVLVALGTHQAMSDEAINRRLGITAEERSGKYGKVKVFNHTWDQPDAFVTLEKISPEEILALSNGMLSLEVPVRVNRLVMDYDLVVILGPVFPHEVVGFSGGNKYFFPGISGPEVINFTHWLGALITNHEIIGTKNTPVRKVIDRAASLIKTPKLALCMVAKHEGLSGLYTGTPEVAWSAAADLSAQVHVKYVEKPYQHILSILPEMYDDLWTGGKGMYKMEPALADGGEVVIYSPHITEISYTHGKLLDEVGYHVRDYFVKQWDRFQHYPWGILAHSTHVRGQGTFENGIECPRVTVTVATHIPQERIERVNLNYRDPASIHIEDWAGREDEGILVVPDAGEVLYRLKK